MRGSLNLRNLSRWIASRRARAAESVEFCDSCGQVCDAGCRSAAYRTRMQTHVLANYRLPL